VPMATPAGATAVEISGAAASSATDVWAVGGWGDPATSAFGTLIEHWNGDSWTIVPSPSPGFSALLNGVAALSATDVWAVGVYASSYHHIGLSRTLVLHWNGTAWKRVSSPHPGPTKYPYSRYSGSGLSGLAAVSPRSVWAVGFYRRLRHHGPNSQPLILHWNGTTWRQVRSPAFGGANRLAAVAAVGRNNVWAVGSHNNYSQPLVEHWNGHAWWFVPRSPPGAGWLSSLAVVAGSGIWAVGGYSDQCPYNSLLEHWNGHAWSLGLSLNPSTDELFGIAAASPTAIWVVGATGNNC
jgi:hypothetical protein